jgi:hypothetical protein
MSRLVSPNEMMKAAEEMMLGGRKIETAEDTVDVLAFLAANVQRDLAVNIIKVMVALYPEEFAGVTDGLIEEIVAHQHAELARLN